MRRACGVVRRGGPRAGGAPARRRASGLPASADVLVIGGGCVGAAVCHRFALAGHKAVLVERESGLAQATSAWAAGLVGQVRGSVHRVRLAMESVRTFAQMQKESDESGGSIPGPTWRQTGSIRVAHTPERVEEFKRFLAVCREAGLDAVLESPERARERWPAADFAGSGALACLWCPTDGYLQPADLAASYRHRAVALGARVVCGAAVHSISPSGAGAAVRTSLGDCSAASVVIAAGTHAAPVAESAGCPRLPIVPVRHASYVTPVVPGAAAHFPVLRIMDRSTYVRSDCDRLLVGGFEPEPLSRPPGSFPADVAPEQPDVPWDNLAEFGAAAAELFGEAAAQVASVQQGWPTFAPDGNFIIGRDPGAPAVVYAAACLAHGVSGSAGIAQAVFEAATEDAASQSEYVRCLSPARFRRTDWTQPEAWSRAEEGSRAVYANYYRLAK